MYADSHGNSNPVKASAEGSLNPLSRRHGGARGGEGHHETVTLALNDGAPEHGHLLADNLVVPSVKPHPASFAEGFEQHG